VDFKDFADYLCSQIADITGESAWETAPDLSIATMAARTWLSDKKGLRDFQNLTDVTVTDGQNFEILVQSASETPSRPIALVSTTSGAVTVALADEEIGSHKLTQVDGSNPLNPKNLCLVYDAATGDPLQSSGREIYALLQSIFGATDGAAFNDTTNQAQLSFVRPNATYDDLEACPIADIENKVINYVFADRESLHLWTDQDWRRSSVSVDLASANITVSLDDAYGFGSAVDVDDTDVDWKVTDTKHFYVSDSAGSDRILDIAPASGGDEILFNAPGGITITAGDVDGGANAAAWNGVNLGTNAGEVATTSGDLSLVGYADLTFTTENESTPIPLDDATAGPISGLFSQAFDSISAAIKYAGEHGGVDISLGVAVAGSNYAKDANWAGGCGGLNIDSPHSIDLNTPSGVDTILWANGRLLYGGNGTTKNDVYAGTTPANGDIKSGRSTGFHTGDVVIALQLVQ
jgi:hypothetical protein